jgi:hypothetical protein
MAALPSRPGSACVGRERLAVDRSYATGELAALPADPEAAGTTNADSTPVRRRVLAGSLEVAVGHADHYLEKPLRVDRLIETATALIGRGRPLSDDLRRGNLRAWL